MTGRWRTALAIAAVAGCAGPATPPSSGGVNNAAVDAAPAPVAAAVVVRCAAGAPRGDFNPYDEQRTLDSDGDAVTDHCDGNGDLVSYQCEIQEVGCPGGSDRGRRPIESCYVQTGRVEATTIDCDGHCEAGACAVRCPQAGDRLTYLALDAGGNPIFDSAADPRDFACRLAFDQKSDTFDCVSDPRVGDSFVVAGLGMSSSWCTGGVWGAISDAHCTYSDCQFVDR